uniref:Uncharacterized protein n=1 Tax=Heterorhabditis bacteriophora TaxID=37862 RepID=A0A1I7XSY5_HETBA
MKANNQTKNNSKYENEDNNVISVPLGAWMQRGRGGQYPHFNSPFEQSSVVGPGDGAATFISTHRGRNDCTWAGAYTSKSQIYNSRGNKPYYGRNRGQGYMYRGGSSSRGEKTDFMVRGPKQFNIRDYVIPAMTENPWAKLEAQFEAERASTE